MSLKLDFTLETQKQRSEFVDNYLKTYKPTERELNTIADYILWGKDHSGRNGRQQGLDLRARNSPWNKQHESASLEELCDQGWEQSDWEQSENSPIGKQKACLSRDAVLDQFRDNPDALNEFIGLWREIDELDWALGSRRPGLRERLARHFVESLRGLGWGALGVLGAAEAAEAAAEGAELALNDAEAAELDSYFKAIESMPNPSKRNLVKLRTQQYYLLDQYANKSGMVVDPPNANKGIGHPLIWDWEAGIAVLPLGVKPKLGVEGPLGHLWDQNLGDAVAAKVFESEEAARDLDGFVRLRNAVHYDANNRVVEAKGWDSMPAFAFDFRNVDHLSALMAVVEDLRRESTIVGGDGLDAFCEPTMAGLVRTWDWYLGKANLNPMQLDLLKMRTVDKLGNEKIASVLNEKYGHQYTANYISSILKRQIIGAIAQAATLHLKEVESALWIEDFKKCVRCGHWKLRDGKYWTRRSRSVDGWVSHCKDCD